MSLLVSRWDLTEVVEDEQGFHYNSTTPPVTLSDWSSGPKIKI